MGIAAENVDWLVLGRADTNVSYISYDMNVEKVQDIAGVFPSSSSSWRRWSPSPP